MKKKIILGAALCLGLLSMMVWRCNFQEMEDPLSAVNFKISEMSSLSTPVRGQTNIFYNYETILVSLDQLWPHTQTRICVINRATDQIVKCLLVFSDGNGQIQNLPVWYNVGLSETGQPVNDAGDYYLHVLQIHTRGIKNNFKIPFKIVNSNPPTATVWPTNEAGAFVGGSVLLGGAVYASGAGFPANTEVRLYVVKNALVYNVGDPFSDESGGFETVTTTDAGLLPNTLVWNSASPAGAYDLIADGEPFGQYNNGDAVNNLLTAGFVVQNPAGAADLIQDIACDANGQYMNQFNATDAIYAQVMPMQQVNIPRDHAHLYVTFHKSQWNAGEPLVAIPTVGNLNGPIQCLRNPVTGALQLVALRGSTSASTPPPVKLWPGKYDVVMDVNTNGVYDPGIDVLDGGPEAGFIIPGTSAIRWVFSWQPFTCNCNDDVRHLMVLIVDENDNPLQGIGVVFKLDKGIGQLSNTHTSTDRFGIAHTIFSGGPMGDWSQVAAYPVGIPGAGGAKMYLWGELCYTHNQGIVVGG